MAAFNYGPWLSEEKENERGKAREWNDQGQKLFIHLQEFPVYSLPAMLLLAQILYFSVEDVTQVWTIWQLQLKETVRQQGYDISKK